VAVLPDHSCLFKTADDVQWNVGCTQPCSRDGLSTVHIHSQVPEIVHHFFSSVISGLEKKANEHGYNIMIGLSNDMLKKEQELIKAFTNGSVDGLIISLSKESLQKQEYSHLTELLRNEFPLVFFDRAPKEMPVHKKSETSCINHRHRVLAEAFFPSRVRWGHQREGTWI